MLTKDLALDTETIALGGVGHAFGKSHGVHVPNPSV